jgi:hypothetical protein
VARVLGYRFWGPGSITGTTRKKVVGLERGPLSLVSTTEELLDRKVAFYCDDQRLALSRVNISMVIEWMSGVEVEVEVEVEVNLWPTVSRPVCLGVRRPSGTFDQFFFLLEISFGQLHVCYFVAPSLTRGRVCILLYSCFLALPEQSLLGRSTAELTAIFYCLIWDSPNLEGQVPVFIFPRNRVAQLYPRALGSLYVASYDSLGYGGGILTRLHTG